MINWQKSQLTAIKEPFSAIKTDLIEALRKVYANGKVDLFDFDIENPVEDQPVPGKKTGTIRHISRLLKNPAVVSQIQAGQKVPYEPKKVNIPEVELGSYYLSGLLTEILVRGGAYNNFQEEPGKANDLALLFEREIITYEYVESALYRSTAAWSGYFLDVAWDHTIMIANLKRRKVYLLLATDTD